MLADANHTTKNKHKLVLIYWNFSMLCGQQGSLSWSGLAMQGDFVFDCKCITCIAERALPAFLTFISLNLGTSQNIILE